jgi:probable F420-dependent oxidoreductase
MAPQLGPIGVWSSQLRFGDPGEITEAAAELEELGYGALWLPGGAGGDIFEDCDRVLAATRRITVATGILNIWAHPVAEAAAGHARLTTAYPGRFLLGLGVSHGPMVERLLHQQYRRPLATMASYLDGLDAASPPVPASERVLAALGPKMLELARDRSAGAHPYLVTPEHTRSAREVLGQRPLLAPEQKVVLETDPVKARQTARAALALYLSLPNYTNNLRRIGFTDDDLDAGGSDRLIDGLYAWGDASQVMARVRQHHDAGADHVCIQVITPDRAVPRAEWRELAAAFV